MASLSANMINKTFSINNLSSALLKLNAQTRICPPLRAQLFSTLQNQQSNIFRRRSNLYQSKSLLCLSAAHSNLTGNDQSNPTGNFNQRLETNFLARQFIESLTPSERVVIKQELTKYEQEQVLLGPPVKNKEIPRPTVKQLMIVGLQTGLPFIGFGFVDNFLMIVAGDLIESYIGMFLPISTMAAAGLGNAFSDVAGIGLAHHIEYFCSKLTNEPVLSSEQFSLSLVSWFIIIAKSLSIFIGCVIGMFPLLFMHHESKSKKEENESK